MLSSKNDLARKLRYLAVAVFYICWQRERQEKYLVNLHLHRQLLITSHPLHLLAYKLYFIYWAVYYQVAHQKATIFICIASYQILSWFIINIMQSSGTTSNLRALAHTCICMHVRMPTGPYTWFLFTFAPKMPCIHLVSKVARTRASEITRQRAYVILWRSLIHHLTMMSCVLIAV